MHIIAKMIWEIYQTMTKEMNYIYTIYKFQSFSKAAAHLYISQPALSAIVRKEEERLKVTLFDRSTNPVSLTEAGKYYIDAAEKIRAIEAEARAHVNDLVDVDSGHISIGAGPFVCCYFLPSLIKGFKKLYPKVTFDVHESTSIDTYISWLIARDADFALSIRPLPKQDFISIPVMKELLILAVPGDDEINEHLKTARLTYLDIREGRHFYKNCPSVSLKEFSGENFILLDELTDIGRRCNELFKNASIQPAVTMRLDQMITAYYMTANGFGCSILRDTTLELVQDTGKIFFYKMDDPLTERFLHLSYRNNQYISHAASAFLDFVKENYTDVLKKENTKNSG